MNKYGSQAMRGIAGARAATAAGRLMFGVFGSFAAFERDLVIERTKVVLQPLRPAGTIRPAEHLGPRRVRR